MRPLDTRNVSAILLIVCSVLDVTSNLMWFGTNMRKWFTESPRFFRWERGLLMAAYVMAALSVSLLEPLMHSAGETVLGSLATNTFLIGAVIALVVESSFVSKQGSIPALEVVMVVILFAGEALLGAALLSSGLLPAWVGLAVVVWNIGWPVVLPFLTPRDLYYPVLHFAMPLLIGIALLVTR